MKSRIALLLLLSVALCSAALASDAVQAPTDRGARYATVEQRLAFYGPGARARLAPAFRAADVAYPPAAITLVGLKQERELQVYAGDSSTALRHITSYPVLAASGELGPKLALGDLQVPEGLYRIDALNPNSKYHLSLRVNYPNAFDRARARDEGRERLGGEIMIHGAADSRGCLALGDAAAEEVFVLVADTGRSNVRVVLSPVDFRRAELPGAFRSPRPWVPELHATIRAALMRLPPPASQVACAGAGC